MHLMAEIPQRRLAYELRIAIDRCIRSPGDARFMDRLVSLVDENPRGVWSTHVQHNLGVTRRSWLVANVRGAPPPGRCDAKPPR